jgi:hypothetical protein
MPSARQNPARSGPHLSRPGAAKVYRGSRKRLRGIKWHEHTPVAFWIFVALVIMMLFLLIPMASFWHD